MYTYHLLPAGSPYAAVEADSSKGFPRTDLVLSRSWLSSPWTLSGFRAKAEGAEREAEAGKGTQGAGGDILHSAHQQQLAGLSRNLCPVL